MDGKAIHKSHAVYEETSVKQNFDFARKFWIKDAQAKAFPKDIAALSKNVKSADGHETGPVCILNWITTAFFGSKVGHLKRRFCLYSGSPSFLPKDHQYTVSLIFHTHVENHHASVDWVHFFLRQQFWILTSRQLIRQVIGKCFECQKTNSRRGEQIMAPLPRSRVTFEPPFSRVGVDYTGSLDIKATIRGAVTQPAYVVIFTCFVTRAVHFEIVLSNEAEGFLMALKRMVSVRGMPRHIFSDNAPYFKQSRERT